MRCELLGFTRTWLAAQANGEKPATGSVFQLRPLLDLVDLRMAVLVPLHHLDLAYLEKSACPGSMNIIHFIFNNFFFYS